MAHTERLSTSWCCNPISTRVARASRLSAIMYCLLIAAAAPHDAVCEGEGCIVEESVISLLQLNLKHDLAVDPDPASVQVWSDPNLGVEYPPALYFGLGSPKRPDGFYSIKSSAQQCAILLPNVTARDSKLMWTAWEPDPVPSNFLFGECPHPLRGISRRVGSALNNRSSGAPKGPGFNPSFVALPAHLVAAFPAGRWLMILRVGGEDQTGACPRQAGAQRPATLRSPEYFSDWGSRIVVLDENFETIAEARVEMLGGDPFWGATGITDAQLANLGNGDLHIGFNAYSWDYSHLHVSGNSSWEHRGYWRSHELVGLLQVRAVFVNTFFQLEAWVDQRSTRMVEECPRMRMHAPGPKKNLGFFTHAETGHLEVLDRIFPTHVGNLSIPIVHDAPTDTPKQVSSVCYGYHEDALAPHLGDIAAGVLDADLDAADFQNGPNLVWINETAEYLGLGHFDRGANDKNSSAVGSESLGMAHHGTHFFFTVSAGPPYKLQRLSPEFCFASARHPSDCESVQYASSLAVDGDKLHIGYGIMDCEAAVMTVNTVDVVETLRLIEVSAGHSIMAPAPWLLLLFVLGASDARR
mmetsp:Transcript_18767/g.41144  ORF Transcript_18767/g.41144 Transcript_18767/m.41144 type:complete len:582 (+) Transcript_18767:56-1801(+)